MSGSVMFSGVSHTFVMDDVAGRISAYLTQAAVNVDAGSDERRTALAPLC